jgi:DNA-binding MarR family transcriptional regulator
MPDRLPNLLGALSLALADAQTIAAREASGLSLSACAALMTLAQYPGETIRALSQTLGLTHSVAVRLADDLVGRGLLTRGSGADKREVTLRLTKDGEAVQTRILEARTDVLRRALADLSSTKRSALEGALSTMLQGLTEHRAQANHLCRLCDETACGFDACPVEVRTRQLEQRA